MEAVAIVPSTTTYTCGICMDDFPEEGVVKHCEGRHIFCRECFNTWNSTYSQTTCNEGLTTIEHYSNDSTTHHIPELIYKIKTKCPICRKEIRLTDDGITEDYTGKLTKNVPCYCNNYHIECSYLNGKKHGSYKRTHLNGSVMTMCEFINGRIQGLYTVYDYIRLNSSSEKYYKLYEAQYVDGNIDGIVHYWYANGNMYLEERYKAGIKHGEMKGWHQNGKLDTLTIYDHGKVVSTKMWHVNGNPFLESNFNPLIEGQKHGVQKRWHCTGNLAFVRHYNYGVKCGVHQEFDEHGHLVKEEDFGIPVNEADLI
jgi:antitoxin component YwqK of YwqJK toxin-antitoxin module